jgi:hypothetical protein
MQVRWFRPFVLIVTVLLPLLGPEQALSGDPALDWVLGSAPPGEASMLRPALAEDNPVPTITQLAPSSLTAGGTAFTLTANGTNFIRGSVVRWNGANRGTGFVSSTQLQATIATADIAAAGTASVTIFNPAPGGGTSNALTFTIRNPLPMIHSLNPSSVVVDAAGLALAVVGTDFVRNSVVRWNGSDRETTFVSRNQLRAAVAASDVASVGEANVTVFSPVPGGGTSNVLVFTIKNPLPVVDEIYPSAVTAGGPDSVLTINGANFARDSVVRWNGAERETTFVSSTQLMGTITASDTAMPRTAKVTVFTPAPGGGTSNARTFTVNYPLPTITHLEPRWARVGGVAFTLVVNGANFFRSSVAEWNGSARGTTFVSSTQLRATITALDIASPGTAHVTVVNPAPGGGSSDTYRFRIYDRVLYVFLPVVAYGRRR